MTKQDDAQDSTVGAVPTEVRRFRISEFGAFEEAADGYFVRFPDHAAALAAARADGLEEAAKVVESEFRSYAEIAAAIRALINKDAGGPDAH